MCVCNDNKCHLKCYNKCYYKCTCLKYYNKCHLKCYNKCLHKCSNKGSSKSNYAYMSAYRNTSEEVGDHAYVFVYVYVD